VAPKAAVPNKNSARRASRMLHRFMAYLLWF